MDYGQIEQQIKDAHLRCCGGFYPDPADDLPPAIQTAIIVGNAGNQDTTKFWPTFENNQPDNKNPLENWTRQVLNKVADNLNASVIFPFDGPPYIPILTWAQKVEPVHPSSFGTLIHPTFGLWHAYRGVLLFTEKIELPSTEPQPSPCDTCADQPCTTSCPVEAIKPGAAPGEVFNLSGCVEFLASAKGEVCLQEGCLARRACPIGQEHIYEPNQANFHLTAFLDTFGPKSA